MEGVPVQPNRGRLSGMAPSAGLYGREIRNVGARREVAVADTVVNDDVPTRGTIRQPRSRGQLRSPPAVMREIGTMKFVETTPLSDPDIAARKLVEIASTVEDRRASC